MAVTQSKHIRNVSIRHMGKPTKPWAIVRITYTLGACLIGMIIPAMYMHNIQPLEWLAIPVAFVVANFVEYGVHRYYMHKRHALTSKMLDLHMEHHEYFNANQFAIKTLEDNVALIFPGMVLNSVAVAAVISAYPLWKFVSHNSGLLWIATIMGYYLLMQIFHWMTHHDEGHWVTYIPGIDYLRKHHNVHHHFSEMDHADFNFIIPIADWVLGTNELVLDSERT